MPYPNEHSARLKEPRDFKEKPDWSKNGKFRRVPDGIIYGRIKVPSTADVIWGQLKTQKGKDAAPQAIRFPIKNWTESKARKWLKDNNVKYIKFEPATKKKTNQGETFNMVMEDISVNNFISFANSHVWAMEEKHIEKLFKEIEAKSGKPVNENFTKMEFDGYGYKKAGKAAIIDINGVIEKKFSLARYWFMGMVSTEMLQKDIQNALNDTDIETIVFNIDSPGGTVDGTKELADFIYEKRNEKKFITYGNGMMCSGAYWIGSAAHEIFSYDTSEIGSIGVWQPHIDASGFYDKLGLKITLIYAGKYKVAGHPYGSLKEKDKEIIQERIDNFYDIFVNSIAKNRGVDIKDVNKKMAEGRVFLGEEAKDRGLIDELASVDQVIAYGSVGKNGNSAIFFNSQNNKPSTKGRIMSLFGKDNTELTVESLKENDPVIYSQIHDAGKAEAEDSLQPKIDEAVKNEKQKAVEIFSLAENNPKLLPEIIKAYNDGKSAGEIAVEILKNGNKEQQKEDKKKEFQAGAADSASTIPPEEEKKQIENAAQRWDSDSNLRNQYEKKGGRDAYMNHMAEWQKEEVQKEYGGNLESYLAFQRNAKK